MNSKKCCVSSCDSSSNREQDRGVTFHRLPKNEVFRSLWISQARLSLDTTKEKSCFICSRHFRKLDFEALKTSKYLLKNDAVPTIFPWGITSLEELQKVLPTTAKSSKEINTMEKKEANAAKNIETIPDKSDVDQVISQTSVPEKLKESSTQPDLAEVAQKDNSPETISDSNSQVLGENDSSKSLENSATEPKQLQLIEKPTLIPTENIKASKTSSPQKKRGRKKVGRLNTSGSSAHDEEMQSLKSLIEESIHPVAKSNDEVEKPVECPMLQALIENPLSSAANSPKTDLKNNKLKISSRPSDNYAIGTKVEVKDFGEQWYPARIVEVDNDDMEILVHYENWNQKYDEWISMSSPRLKIIMEAPPPSTNQPTFVTYEVGERCMARWSDNRKFPATVCKVLENGKYQVKFDDGFVRNIASSMMAKATPAPSTNPASPISSGTRKLALLLQTPPALVEPPLILDTHLFDPSRDHLGSKEERRDMKRKLNVKDLFKKNRRVESPAADKSLAKIPREKDSGANMAKKITKVKQEPSIKTENDPVTPKVETVKSDPISQPHNIDTSVFLKNEWCCRWLNGQPVGIVNNGKTLTERDEEGALARISVEVYDHRIPKTWKKCLTRRRIGTSAGKWDVILIDPNGRRFRSTSEMRTRMLEADSAELEQYSVGLLDFSLHRKLSKNLGWDVTDANYKEVELNPFLQKAKNIKPPVLVKLPSSPAISPVTPKADTPLGNNIKLNIQPKSLPTPVSAPNINIPPQTNVPPLDEGFVYVGSLKVQIIENLLRCPKEGCFKNFRKDNLLQMHVKHYHRELIKFLGETPNVADLAYARTIVEEAASPKARSDIDKPLQKLKERRLTTHIKTEMDIKEEVADPNHSHNQNISPSNRPGATGSFIDASPKLRNALITDVKQEHSAISEHDNKLTESPSKYEGVKQEGYQYFGTNRAHHKRSKDRRSNKRPENEPTTPIQTSNTLKLTINLNNMTSQHILKRKSSENRESLTKRKRFDQVDSWEDLDETRSSFGYMDQAQSSPFCKTEGTEQSARDYGDESSQSYINESGEKIKIVHMKREEIINCHCGVCEEDGLMIQCELCLCWQHGLCHNIEKESQVPDKYLCQICLHPYRQRRSQKHLNSQEWIYEGRLHRIVTLPFGELTPGDTPRAQMLKKSHELTGNIMQLRDLLFSLQCKIEVAEKKNHPKLYLWAKSWDDQNFGLEDNKLSLNGFVHGNLPILPPKEEPQFSDLIIDELKLGEDEVKEAMAIVNSEVSKVEPPLELPQDIGDSQTKDKDVVPPTTLLSNLLASPEGTSLDLPISHTELESFATSVQVSAPQPEAAIDSSECRLRLIQHIDHTQRLLDSRLDLLEEYIAELETQDPTYKGSESAENYPKTKQTIQMILRDLATMEEMSMIY